MKSVYLIGYPVSHSLSPKMHAAAFRSLGLDWRYEAVSVPSHLLAQAIERLRDEECVGANVTIPHKQAILPLLDELGESARRVGAVNTIVKRGGRLFGENTDVYGVRQALLSANVDPRGVRVALLGAGGAGRAAAFALAEAGASSIAVWNRTAERARVLAGDLRKHYASLALAVNPPDATAGADIVIHATSVGMVPHDDASPLQPGWEIARGAVALDLVYRPTRTRFLREAEQAGARALGGLAVLVYQGAAALELWTGRPAPVQVMLDAANEQITREERELSSS